MRQAEVVVIEVPVLARQITEIRAEYQEFAAWFQGDHHLVEQFIKNLFIREMLKKVGSENHVGLIIDDRA